MWGRNIVVALLVAACASGQTLHLNGDVGFASRKNPLITIATNYVIWTNGIYTGFPDVARWSNRWWVTCREGSAHTSYDGVGRVITSTDAVAWASALSIPSPSTNWPNVLETRWHVAPDGRLCGRVSANSSWAGWTNFIIHTQDGATWSTTQGDDAHLKWQAVRVGGALIAAGASNAWTSVDGLAWSRAVDMGRTNSHEAATWVDDAGIVRVLTRNITVDTASNYSNSSPYCGYAEIHPPYIAATHQGTLPQALAGGPEAEYTGNGMALIGSRALVQNYTARAQIFSYRDGMLFPEAALQASEYSPDVGTFGLCYTNAVLHGVYYSKVSGKTAIYWFAATVE